MPSESIKDLPMFAADLFLRKKQGAPVRTLSDLLG
jgi:hypothetical protein